jgi:hypothetical protein
MFTPGRFALPVSLLLLETVAASFAGAAGLEVHIHNDAELKRTTLDRCMSQLRTILVLAGAAVDIRLCQGGEGAVACEHPSGGVRVVDLRILPGIAQKMRNVRRPPLGQSVASETGGVYAIVFLASVQQQAAASNIPWTTLVAYASAHEIGHLLLGANAHTLNGVMKANWDAKDMRAMFQNAVHFNREQQFAIANCCGGLGGSESADIR